MADSERLCTLSQPALPEMMINASQVSFETKLF
jgi:hypothetical protein